MTLPKLKTKNSKLETFWRRLRRNRMAVAGLVLVLGLFAVALLAPWLAPYRKSENSCVS